MTAFLAFLAGLAFGVLGLNRLFAETWAFREFHISLLEKAGFTPRAGCASTHRPRRADRQRAPRPAGADRRPA